MKPYLQMGNAYQTTGVQRTLYQNVDFNMMNWPQNLLYQALASGNLAPAIPNPLTGIKIALPDGDSTVPALGWQSANAVGSGLYRVGTQDFGWAVNSSLVTEWLASEFRVNYLTAGQIVFPDSNKKLTGSASLFWDISNLRLQLGAGGAVGTPQSVFGYYTNANPDPTFSSGNDQFRIGEGRALGNPPNAPTAVASAGGLTGNYLYAYIEIDASGNATGLSPTLAVAAVSNQYTVTVPQTRAGALARMLCRTKAGGSTFYLVKDFAAGDDTHRTIYVDNTVDGSLVTVIGTTGTADATKLYKLTGQVNTAWGGVFLCTHPDQTSNAQDLTILASDPTSGKVGVDVYSGSSFRSVANAAVATRVTGTNASAYHLTCGYLGTTADGSSAATVYSISPQGAHTLAPNTSGVTNPSWLSLSGGVAGNYFVARLSGTQNQGGLYVSSNNEPYFGSNIAYSGGDTYSTSNASAAWRIGNPTASASFPFNIFVAAAGTAGNAITWTTAASITSAGVWEFPSGTNSNPSLTFQANANTGIYWVSSGNLGITCNGVGLYKFSNSTFFMLSDTATMAFGASSDCVFTRDAPQIFAHKNGNNAQTLRVYAGNGANLGIVTVNESLTIAAAATTDSATTIPAGAVILAVAVRVTTVIPTAATFTVTAATGGNTFDTAAVAVAANTTDAGTAAGALYTAAGTKVRITPNLTPGAATGVVRLAISYYLSTPPTS